MTNDALLGDYFDIVYLFTDAKPDKELIKACDSISEAIKLLT